MKALQYRLDKETLLKNGWTTVERETQGTFFNSSSVIVRDWIPPKGRDLSQEPLNLDEAIKLNEVIGKEEK